MQQTLVRGYNLINLFFDPYKDALFTILQQVRFRDLFRVDLEEAHRTAFLVEDVTHFAVSVLELRILVVVEQDHNVLLILFILPGTRTPVFMQDSYLCGVDHEGSKQEESCEHRKYFNHFF